MSKTPRTDAKNTFTLGGDQIVRADFARLLEIELLLMTESRDKWKAIALKSVKEN